jgi:hypothetical protein
LGRNESVGEYRLRDLRRNWSGNHGVIRLFAKVN